MNLGTPSYKQEDQLCTSFAEGFIRHVVKTKGLDYVDIAEAKHTVNGLVQLQFN